MKKLTDRQIAYFRVIRGQNSRAQRKASALRTPKARSAVRRRIVTVLAPANIDIYSSRSHNAMTAFLEELRRHAKSSQAVRICFRNTTHISAAAGILLKAEIDRLVDHFGAGKFSANLPARHRNSRGVVNQTCEAVLGKIGVLSALGVKLKAAPSSLPLVDCWQTCTGLIADGRLPGTLLKDIREKIPEVARKPLYRGAIEALSNCVEHAHSGVRQDGLNIEDRRWWMFTALIDRRLVVLVCDLGVGIPNTIKNTQPPTFIELIFTLFGFRAVTDGGWIKAATLVKETSTYETHRGKGGGDLRQLVRIDESASLSIFSNRGYYKLTNLLLKSGESKSAEYVSDMKRSILGTIIEWSIDLAA